MSLVERLAATGHTPTVPVRREPKGYEQGIKYEAGQPREVALNLTEIPEDETKWRDEIARVTGLTVPEGRKVELAQVRYWGDPESPLIYCRFTIEDRPTLSAADLDELVRAARRKVSKRKPATGQGSFVVALGDLQLGKMDGDGTRGTVERFYDTLEQSIAEFKRHKTGHVVLAYLGDCIEGFVSQGGANASRTELTTTEQVRTYRRMVMDQVKAFAPLAERITLAGVPGNHDEAHRPIHTYGDSWATEALVQVADAMALAGNYGHVETIVPRRDELTLTLDASGTILALAHGHQFPRGDWSKWWQGQSHNRQPVGEADMLLCGHLHHLRVVGQGERTFMQAPALESRSQWWVNKTGEVGKPGIVTFTAANGGWDNMRVLS